MSPLRTTMTVAARAALAVVCSLTWFGFASAQSTKPDRYQRSYEIYNYLTTGESGAQRGEALYFYKCWMCHNQYTKPQVPLQGQIGRAHV